jgi:hypothetical protein
MVNSQQSIVIKVDLLFNMARTNRDYLNQDKDQL